MEVLYKRNRPIGGIYYGEPFKFTLQKIDSKKSAYMAETNSGFQIVHSGNFLVAVFEPHDNNPTIYTMPVSNKDRELVEGILRE